MTLFLPDDAPIRTRERLDQGFSPSALRSEGTEFVVYDPQLAEDDVILLHFPFRWNEESRPVAGVCTSGLMRYRQAAPRKWSYQRIELAVGFYSPGLSEAFLHQFLLACRDFREWLADGEVFGFGDWVQQFPLVRGLPSALLIPPTPELLTAGLRPGSELSGRFVFSAFAPAAWCDPDVLTRGGSVGFLQVCPLYAQEYEYVAKTRDGFRFFLEALLAGDQDIEKGADVACRVLDPNRRAVA